MLDDEMRRGDERGETERSERRRADAAWPAAARAAERRSGAATYGEGEGELLRVHTKHLGSKTDRHLLDAVGQLALVPHTE